jgi:hypothetical protein
MDLEVEFGLGPKRPPTCRLMDSGTIYSQSKSLVIRRRRGIDVRGRKTKDLICRSIFIYKFRKRRSIVQYGQDIGTGRLL